jgi:hypothetical protein
MIEQKRKQKQKRKKKQKETIKIFTIKYFFLKNNVGQIN